MHGRSLLLLFLTATLAAIMPHTAHAQLVEKVRIQVDNDAFNFWVAKRIRPDYEYTAGTRVVVQARTASWWGRFVPGRSACAVDEPPGPTCLSTQWEVGQRIYTPRNNSRAMVPGERPHAGWLYGAMTAQGASPVELHSVRLEVGVTGPPSLADRLQTLVHRVGGFREPRGWEKQLAFEPGALARYDYVRLLAEPEVSGTRVADLTQEAGVSLGNVRSGAHAGGTVRVGYDVPRPWGANQRTAARASVFVTAGLRADLVLHDLTLDGNTFRDSPRVDKLPLVGHYHFGLSLRLGGADFGYRVVSRTREYQTEPEGHRYSSIGVSFRP